MEERTTNDICNDINQVFEDYERDKKYIKNTKIQELKEELFISLMALRQKEDKVDSSFVELVNHLYKCVSWDELIDFDHIGIYQGLFCMIEYVFPNISNYYMGNIFNTNYSDLSNKKNNVKRKVK